MLQPVLSLLGLLATYLAVGVSFGLCSAVGLPYSPVHSILPLLMLGLGVDDMFVIVQSWHNLKPQARPKYPFFYKCACAVPCNSLNNSFL